MTDKQTEAELAQLDRKDKAKIADLARKVKSGNLKRKLAIKVENFLESVNSHKVGTSAEKLLDGVFSLVDDVVTLQNNYSESRTSSIIHSVCNETLQNRSNKKVN